MLDNSCCAVGNSSSFLREGSFLGVPAVLVGDRQKGREHGSNVSFADYEKTDILDKVRKKLNEGRIKGEQIFGAGNAGVLIADKLAELDLNINKRMTY